MGLDVSYLYPTKGLQLWAFRNMNPAVAAALVRIYNDWLFEFCSYDPKRLKPVPGLSLHDPKDAVSELKRVAALGAGRSSCVPIRS
jgi:predicted TIM-barrel fold metal-dependent hydrolase